MKRRPRINRWTESRRDLIFSTSIKQSLVQPHFVVVGNGVNEPIESMPGISRQSVDVLIETIESDMKHGINAHMLFGVIDSALKDANASKAHDSQMPLQQAVRQLKEKHGKNIVLFTDVCLCTATDHGHCGVIHDNEIDNDLTLPELIKIAISHAQAGSDYVSASDMMDGRVKAIRKALEAEGFTSTGIMSYSVKYASSFYGPFRDAASSSPEHGDRKSHQMDVRSGYKEAILEAKSDEKEGADIIMVKPAMTYLDIVRKVSDSVSRPVAVYNVSGEYSMVIGSTQEGAQRKAMVQEIFYSFARAGADVIVSYHTREAVHGNWFD